MLLLKLRRGDHIPVVQATLSDFSKQTTPVLDILKSDFVQTLQRSMSMSEFIVTDSTAGRLDLISWQIYQKVDYWWIIGEVNGIINPLYDVYTGRTLSVPTRSSIDFILQSSKYTSTLRVVDIP